jgi:hypothetical protein
MDTDVQPQQEGEEIGEGRDLVELADVRDTKGGILGFLWDNGLGFKGG